MKYLMLLLFITVLVLTHILARNDSNEISEEFIVYVSGNKLDFGSIGIKEPFVVSRDRKIDIDNALKFTDSINVPKTKLVNDKNGVLIDKDVLYRPKIILMRNDGLYAAYIANFISKAKFCFGSTIIYKTDTLYNNCISRSPMYWPPDDSMPPKFSIVVLLAEEDAFCLRKQYSKNGEYAYESLCYNGLNEIDKCGYDYIYNDINDGNLKKMSECKRMASSIDSQIFDGYSRNSVIIDKELKTEFAIKKYNDYKRKTIEYINSNVKDRKLHRLYKTDIEWMVQ